jgi:heterodisulfide reductase subunit B
MLASLGAKVQPFGAADKCCGSYQVLGSVEGANSAAAAILNLAAASGIEALATSCPLCEYNLGRQQGRLLAASAIGTALPTFYFTQLLALALGIEEATCHFEMNEAIAVELLRKKTYLAAA